MSNYIYIAKTR